MTPDDVIGSVGAVALTFGGVRYYLARRRERLSLPRLCACTHGSGMHGLDGCRGVVIRMRIDGVELAKTITTDCRCTAYDGAGARAPR